MKKRSIAVKYMQAITKKPWLFYGVLLFGVAVFIYLTLNTHIDTAEGSLTLFHLIFIKAGRGL